MARVSPDMVARWGVEPGGLRRPLRQRGKLRPCDNARASGHNDATSTFERMLCENADFPARVAVAFQAAAEAWEVSAEALEDASEQFKLEAMCRGEQPWLTDIEHVAVRRMFTRLWPLLLGRTLKSAQFIGPEAFGGST